MATNMKKTMDTGKPKFIHKQIVERGRTRASKKENNVKKHTNTAKARENYVCHGINLVNKIPPEILAEERNQDLRKQ